MEIDKAKEIFEGAFNIDISHLSNDDRTLMGELRGDVYSLAVEYARIRTDWFFKTVEEKIENDKWRSISHNVFIEACNILSRNMNKLDMNTNWRLQMGQDRKEIGDFACYVHLFLSLEKR